MPKGKKKSLLFYEMYRAGISAGGLPAILISDSFTDPDSTSLDAHTPDVDWIGGGWSITNGTNTIQTNRSEPSVGGAWGMSQIDVGVSDFVITGTVVFGGEGDFKFYFRSIGADDQDFLSLSIDNYAQGGFGLARRIAGGYAFIEVSDPDPTGVNGARTMDFRVTAIGDQVTIEDITSDITVGPVTTDIHQTETFIGFGDSGGDVQWSLDNLLVVPA